MKIKFIAATILCLCCMGCSNGEEVIQKSIRELAKCSEKISCQIEIETWQRKVIWKFENIRIEEK